MTTLNIRSPFLFTLLLFSLLSLSFSQTHSMPKLPKEPLKECISGQLYYDCSVCACFPLQTRQNTANLIITIPFAVCSLVFLFYYFTVKPLREKPGNIVLAVSLASFVINTINTIENTKSAWSYADEAVDSPSCLATGYVKVLATVLLNYYTMAFFVIYVVTIQKSSTSGKIKGAHVHGLALMISLGVMAILGPLNMIGRTLHGTCGIKSMPGVWMSILSYGNLTILGFVMMALAKKYLKRMYRRSEMEEDFIRHYLLFLGVISNLYLAIGILDGIRGLMLNSEVLDAVKNGEIHLGITAILKTLLFNLIPALLLFARLREPTIYEHVKTGSLLCKGTKRVKEDEENRRLSLDLPNNEIAIEIKKGLLEEEKSNKRIHSSSNETKKEKKKDIICSMLAGLNYFFKMRKERLKKGGSQELIKSPLNQAKHFIHYEILKSGAPQVVRELKRRKNKLSTGDLTVHAQELFDEMIELDHAEEAISQAWYFVGNYGNLINHGYKTEEDGKAVFVSSNANFMLKEISKEELKNLLKMLPDYVEYMKGNGETMLARIYGIFSFNQVMGNHENICMVLMKNVVGFPEEYIRDLYKIGANEEYIHYTGESLKIKRTGSMKKKSFFSRESGKIVIEGLIDKEEMMRILKRDIEFLAGNNLKNYVLQVSVVNNKGVYAERLDKSVIREVKEIDEMSENLEDLIDDEGRWENVEDYYWEEIQSCSIEGGDIGDAKMEIQEFWKSGGNCGGKLRKIETIWGRLKNYGKEEGDLGKIYGKKFIDCIESLL